jgi:BirA family transcriptional regulator, biotin operon repressor / biotin---[acetyl-CoA-carboxylase] ligase
LRVLRLPTVDSTNLEARRLAEQGETGPLWIVSAEQTAGKGRLGRSWVSEVGNFYGTLLLPTNAPLSSLPQLSFVAALAVHQAASGFVDESRITLKWPNDCLLDGAKFCGILCEALGDGRVAIGIGINIAHVPEGLPYQAQKLPKADVESVFQKLSISLSNYVKIWHNGAGFSEIRRIWMQRCPHIEMPASVDGQHGKILGVAEDGALQLQLPGGTIKSIYAGDVRVEYRGNT